MVWSHQNKRVRPIDKYVSNKQEQSECQTSDKADPEDFQNVTIFSLSNGTCLVKFSCKSDQYLCVQLLLANRQTENARH